MVWRPEDPQGNEAAKIAPLIAPYTRGPLGVDVGCGTQTPYPHFIGIDSGKQWGQRVAEIHADGEVLPFADDQLDFVFSSHFLEHTVDYRAVLAEWWRCIKPDGHLVLYLPHAELYPKMGQPGANPDHKHDFLPEDIRRAMEEITPRYICLEDQVRGGGQEYSFFQVFQKRARDAKKSIYRPWRPRRIDEPPRCLIVRFGGCGDMMWVSAVLPALKRQGYEITVNTTPNGQSIIQHDPHVDHWMIQDKDQVPNERLAVQQHYLAQRYDRMVVYSESIEETLLPSHTRVAYSYPDDVRRRLFGKVNYIDRHFQIAGMPGNECGEGPRFYPSAAEEKWAKARKAELMKIGAPVIVWALSGSATHKVYPWIDRVFAGVMLKTKAVIVMVGDPISEMLEAGWEKEPRVISTCGKWSMRESLAFAQEADLVVGPETGILNAVSHMPMPKILMLSHSSHDNLSRDWVNTDVVEPPPTVECFPCHRMHYGFSAACPQHPETGAAYCATAIPHEQITALICRFQAEAAE